MYQREDRFDFPWNPDSRDEVYENVYIGYSIL